MSTTCEHRPVASWTDLESRSSFETMSTVASPASRRPRNDGLEALRSCSTVARRDADRRQLVRGRPCRGFIRQPVLDPAAVRWPEAPWPVSTSAPLWPAGDGPTQPVRGTTERLRLGGLAPMVRSPPARLHAAPSRGRTWSAAWPLSFGARLRHVPEVPVRRERGRPSPRTWQSCGT